MYASSGSIWRNHSLHMSGGLLGLSVLPSAIRDGSVMLVSANKHNTILGLRHCRRWLKLGPGSLGPGTWDLALRAWRDLGLGEWGLRSGAKGLRAGAWSGQVQKLLQLATNLQVQKIMIIITNLPAGCRNCFLYSSNFAGQVQKLLEIVNMRARSRTCRNYVAANILARCRQLKAKCRTCCE